MKVRDCNGGRLHEIPKGNLIIQPDIIAILCPICKEKSFKVEPDLYSCDNCKRLWSVEA